MAYQEFIARILQKRKALGISQKQLAVEAGMHQSRLCELEKNKRGNVYINTLQRIEAALCRLEQKSHSKSENSA